MFKAVVALIYFQEKRPTFVKERQDSQLQPYRWLHMCCEYEVINYILHTVWFMPHDKNMFQFSCCKWEGDTPPFGTQYSGGI